MTYTNEQEHISAITSALFVKRGEDIQELVKLTNQVE